MNANRMRMAFGVYLVMALFTIPTVHAKPPIKELENRVAELEATAVAVQAELDSINATINQLQTDLDAEAATREDQVNQLDGRIVTNESGISANFALIDGHEARITTNESDINANSTLIDDNTNRINALRPSVSVRANGVRIGTYLNTIDSGSSTRPTHITVMNDNEYVFHICLSTGECNGENEGDLVWPIRNFDTSVFYTTPDCTDQGYLQESELEEIAGLGSLLKASGYVFDNAGAIYYSPVDSQPILDEIRSYTSATGSAPTCQLLALTPRVRLYPVFPNDPSVTGVSTSSFALPLSLGF